ncbi:GntR family transcriptional regulator [Niveispirillum sp. BGYR6]|uniref:GntR family transcriptional regulator n=1 Tax=Niveispirillum sp. BGYR6 TaxID=2971249 RepID=UPI0022B99889|nr:GntR family transcriptional regulator [Niveispirillum sp. BGYR6]
MSLISPIGLEAIETVPLHELVYKRLTHALMSGQIEPGRKLTSRKLAAELGTSDMPVRAALLRLQALKVLTPLPTNGTLTLPPMTRERFLDLMKTRQVCEGAATEMAAQHLTRAQIRALKLAGAGLTQAARDQDIARYLLCNYEFKFTVYRMCGSESLLFLIETLWLQVGPFLRQFAGKFGGDLSGILTLDHHPAVIDALERRDGPAAAAAMRADIADGAHFLNEHAEFF